jgi:hypothetical protein
MKSHKKPMVNSGAAKELVVSAPLVACYSHIRMPFLEVKHFSYENCEF